MEFDLFGLSMRDLSTRNVIVMSNRTSPLYTMGLPGSITPSSGVVAALAAAPHVLFVVAPTTWHHRLGHLLFNVQVINMIFVMRVSWANTPGYPLVAHHIV
jgi:hypothetical protein